MRGAAGGLAGGLAALGADLVSGFELVAEHVDLEGRVEAADVVVTGEGFLDAQSLDGKVVGGVCALAADAGRPVVVVAGDTEAGVVPAGDVTVISLVQRFGEQRARREPQWCIEHAVRDVLGS